MYRHDLASAKGIQTAPQDYVLYVFFIMICQCMGGHHDWIQVQPLPPELFHHATCISLYNDCGNLSIKH